MFFQSLFLPAVETATHLTFLLLLLLFFALFHLSPTKHAMLKDHIFSFLVLVVNIN